MAEKRTKPVEEEGVVEEEEEEETPNDP